MWTRKALKDNAKLELRQSYWLSFAVCLVAGFLGGGSSSGSSGSLSSSSADTLGELASDPVAITIFLIVMLFVFAFAICFSAFVGGPITVGKSAFFVRCVRGHREFGNLFSSFKKGYYIQTVKTMFLMNLYIFLWSLLFIIPGIIKAYEYRMIPYLLSDNPSLPTSEAFRMSKEMTSGEKLNMWVLDLSFIGWYILGMLALLIGTLFVTPYVEATSAQLYFALCAKMNAQYPPQPPMGYQPQDYGRSPVFPPRDDEQPPYQGPEF